MEILKLFWLGPPHIVLKGRAIKLETRKVAALLAYLSLNQGQCQRERLATMFWPENGQQKALSNLRRTLFSLNSSLPGWTEADRETITLKHTNELWVDVDAFQQLLLEGQEHSHSETAICGGCLSILSKAVQHYRGDFLEGLNLSDSPGFDEWQIFQRDSLRQEFGEILQRLSLGYAERGQLDQAIASARQWVALDRLYEPACRTLMTLFSRSGKRTAALHQYEELAGLLDEQLGQDPEPETRRLYESVRGQVEKKKIVEPSKPPASFPLLKTKLYIPTAPSSRVLRSRLIDCLGEAEQKALTLISAPAGFGKSTLLAEWVAQTSLPVAWLSLDNGENDPYRFLSYLMAAFESLHEDVGTEDRQIMQSAQPVSPLILLASLISDLQKIPGPHVLVMDDYQFITEHAVHETMAYLLDHLPQPDNSGKPISLPSIDLNTKINLLNELDFTMYARSLILSHDYPLAIDLLTQAADIAEKEGRVERLIKVLILQAIALYDSGEEEKAITTLMRSLLLAEPEGYQRIFLDEGEPLLLLLKRLDTSKTAPQPQNFVGHLLEASLASAQASF